MTTTEPARTGGGESRDSSEWTGRLSAADVHGVVFTRAGFGRRGYEESEVDYFLDRVQVELRRMNAEKADLRDEVSRAKRQVETAGVQTGAAAAVPDREEASLQAVRILSAAQQTADQYVADAENYSRRVTSDARDHSEEMVEEAKNRVRSMIAEAERVVGEAAETERVARQAAEAAVAGGGGHAAAQLNGDAGAGEATRQELEDQVTYLKAFSQVCRVQLRSYLEALLRDIEDEWGKADPAALGWRTSSAPRPGATRSVPPGIGPGAPVESAGSGEAEHVGRHADAPDAGSGTDGAPASGSTAAGSSADDAAADDAAASDPAASDPAPEDATARIDPVPASSAPRPKQG